MLLPTLNKIFFVCFSFFTCYRVCKRTAWILIRLRGCAGWSGSMLVANPLCWFCRDAAHIFVKKVSCCMCFSINIRNHSLLYQNPLSARSFTWKYKIKYMYIKSLMLLFFLEYTYCYICVFSQLIIYNQHVLFDPTTVILIFIW
jgi:hypothetical protein